jgi:hypothetical protein
MKGLLGVVLSVVPAATLVVSSAQAQISIVTAPPNAEIKVTIDESSFQKDIVVEAANRGNRSRRSPDPTWNAQRVQNGEKRRR